MIWHVSSVVKKEAGSETVNVTSYVHLFDPCSQDWFAVASIVEDLLEKIKSDFPRVKNVIAVIVLVYLCKAMISLNLGKENKEPAGLFDCPELNCNYVFESIEELELHIGLGQPYY
jgi:hypothetical protein